MADFLDMDIGAALTAELENRAMRASQALHAASLEVLGGERSGRTYAFYGAAYTASAPGEPPAERSGALRNSWRPLVSYPVQQHGDTLTVTAGIVSDVWYSVLFDPDLPGYDPGPHPVAPRPFVEAIRDLAEPEIEAIFAAPFRVGA